MQEIKHVKTFDRPSVSDLEIVQVIASHYRVPATTALEWISLIDAADVARKIVDWKLL